MVEDLEEIHLDHIKILNLRVRHVLSQLEAFLYRSESYGRLLVRDDGCECEVNLRKGISPGLDDGEVGGMNGVQIAPSFHSD